MSVQIIDEVSDLLPIFTDYSLNQLDIILGNHLAIYSKIGFESQKDPDIDDEIAALKNHFSQSSKQFLSKEKSFLESLLNQDWETIASGAYEKSREVFPSSSSFKNPILHFLLSYVPTDAQVLDKNNFGVNLGYHSRFCNEYGSVAQVTQKIRSALIHESNHDFLDQVRQQKGLTRQSYLLEGVFAEGLATFIEDIHHSQHNDYIGEKELWLPIINDVAKEILTTNSLDSKKYLQQAMASKVSKKRNSYYHEASEALTKGINKQEAYKLLNKLLFRSNGPAYHMGYLMLKMIEQEQGTGAIKLLTTKPVNDFFNTYREVSK